jgi:PAS domain S-box-containing protein
MNENFYIFDRSSVEGKSLANIFSENGKTVDLFSDPEILVNALNLKIPAMILLNVKNCNQIICEKLFSLKATFNPRPVIVLFSDKEIEKKSQTEYLKLGFDGVLTSLYDADYVNTYLNSLLQIRDDLEIACIDQLKYRMLFETMLSAYALHEIIVDSEGTPVNYKYLEVNPAFEKITGLKAGDVVGKTLFEVFPNAQSHVVETYGAVALENAKLQFEQFSAEDNKYFEIIAFSPRKGQFSTVFTDITEYKEAIKNVEKSEAKLKELNETKDKFFSIIAHDLKNPFHNILGFVELLYNEFDDYSEDEKKNLLEQIKNSTESAYDLLVNLLEWSRLQLNRVSAKPVEINLQQLIEQEIKGLIPMAQTKNIQIINELDDDAIAFGDSNMIKTVLRNLISNAIKFSYEDNTVTISGNQIPKYMSICVADEGVGIPEEKLENLFKSQIQESTPGTAQEKGTGLGLLLCKEFVEKNKGRIWAESRLGSGSRFNFILPLRES